MAFVVLGEEEFGVFAMISTLITFVILSELGVGPGLTNVLTKHIANGDDDAAGTAFATAFFLTTALAALGCLMLVLTVMCLPIEALFGQRFAPFAEPMRHGVALGTGIVFLKMITSLGDRARAAYQETFLTNLYGAGGNLLAGATLILGIRHLPQVWFLILAINGTLALAAALNLLHLWWQRPHLRPRFTKIDRTLAKFLIRDGLAFCATMSLAPIAKDLGLRVILGHLGGPAAVAVFDILERLLVFVFGFIVMFTFPLWPALSDAAARRDLAWIETARKRLYTLALGGGLLFTLGLSTLGPWAIDLWLQGELTLTRSLLALFSLYVAVHIWHHVHHIFLAGLDSIRLVSIIVLLELPFFLLAGYTGFALHGFPGLFIALAGIGLFSSILYPHVASRHLRTLEASATPQSLSRSGAIITAT